jgi:hypothetical protein
MELFFHNIMESNGGFVSDFTSGKYNSYIPYVLYVIAIILILVCFYLATKDEYKASWFVGLSGLGLGAITYFMGKGIDKLKNN